MKLFEVEKNYEKETGIITTIENIKKTLNLVNPEFTLFKLSNDFYRFRADILRHTTYGRIYWTEDVDTSLSQYNTSYPEDFFRTENDELWITGSNLDDILIGKSLPARILSPISEEQGYNFAQKLLSLYESSAAKYGPIMPKGIPDAIMIIDILIYLAEESPNYLRGIQYKWNEPGKNKPELFILTGER